MPKQKRTLGETLTAHEMEDIIAEVESSLAVEKMRMTDAEKENLRRVGRGGLTFDALIASYVEDAKRMAAAHV